MKRVEAAADCFEKGFNCAQAILSTYGTELGIEREHALRVAGPFGVGMGRMGNTCGAVTGAYMVIGLKHGAARAEKTGSQRNVPMRSRGSSPRNSGHVTDRLSAGSCSAVT